MTTTDTPGAPARSGLKRDITGKLLFLFILGDVLGAGVYALVGAIAAEVGGVTWLPMVVALVLALLTAASYAELVTKYPKAGGSAVFAQRAFRSSLVSFLVGFSMLAAGVVSAAGLALAFSGYLDTLVQLPPILGAVLFLAAVGLLNARGIKESMRTNFVMTLIETSGLVLVIVAVAVMLGAGGGDVSRALTFAEGVDPVFAVFGAALLAYYSFVGFETSANVIEEVRDPSRVYPKALFWSLITAGVMYVLVGTAASVALPASDLADSSAPLLDVVAASGVGVPEWLFSLIALIAVANGALLTLIMSSRLAYGMAEQRLLPSGLAKVLPNRGTPWVAILVTTACAMILTFTGGVATLAETVVLLLLIVFLSTNIAVLVLRREKVEHEHFTAWTVLPVLGALSCIVLMTQQSGEVWLRGLILLAIGAVLYAITAITRRRSGAAPAGVRSDSSESQRPQAGPDA